MRSRSTAAPELEYDLALAAAKRLEAAVVEIVAIGGGRPEGDWPS
jgi:hypothetical protein